MHNYVLKFIVTGCYEDSNPTEKHLVWTKQSSNWLCFEHFIYQKCLSFHTKMQKLMFARIAICSYFQF